MAQICFDLGVWMIYLSTNYVFDGTATPYDETGHPNPMSVYGKSKYAGEEAVSKVRNRHPAPPGGAGRGSLHSLAAALRGIGQT